MTRSMIGNAALTAFAFFVLLQGTVSNAAEKGAPPPTAEEVLQHLREVCARHNQVPATDMRSCIDCPFGQHVDRSTGQCVERAPSKAATAEEALQRLREVCARHDQVPATDMKSCIACPFGQHANRLTGQCVDAAPLRGKR
jgi:hypothetical protein